MNTLKLGVTTAVSIAAFVFGIFVSASLNYTAKVVAMSAGFASAVLAASITLLLLRRLPDPGKTSTPLWSALGIILFFLTIYALYKFVGY